MNTEKVIACLKEMGIRPKIAKFRHRIVIQKLVYLLQLKGVEFGFDYGLYVRGPYSPNLTKEIYAKRDKFEQLKTKATLSEKETQTVQEAKEIFDGNPAWLEVAATYAYVYF